MSGRTSTRGARRGGGPSSASSRGGRGGRSARGGSSRPTSGRGGRGGSSGGGGRGGGGGGGSGAAAPSPLTGKNVKEHTRAQYDLRGVASLTEKDVNKVENIFIDLKHMWGGLDGRRADEMGGELEDHVSHVVSALKSRLADVNDNYLRCFEYLLAKHALHDVCISALLGYVEASRGREDPLHSVLSRIFRAHQEIVAQFPRVVASMHAYYRDQLGTLRSQLTSSERETYNVLEAAEILERQKIDEASENRALADELAAVTAERDRLLRQVRGGAGGAGGSGSRRPASGTRGGRGSSAGRPGDSKHGSPSSPAHHGRPGTASAPVHHRGAGGGSSSGGGHGGGHGGGGVTSSGYGQQTHHSQPAHHGGAHGQSQAYQQPQAGSYGGGAGGGGSGGEGSPHRRPRSARKVKDNLPQILESDSFKRLTQPRKSAAERAAEAEAEAAAAAAAAKSKEPFQRELTLNQLRATIEEIYASKKRYDAKCEDSGLPYETMEMHVYTYLNQKYGLRNIIVGWLRAIKEGVEKFKDSDPDVQCFGKILANELHEGYLVDYHYNLKKKIRMLLFAVLQMENPKASDVDISDLYEERIADYLTEQEWLFMVSDIYPQESDQQALTHDIYLIIRKHQEQAAAKRARESEGGDQRSTVRRALDESAEEEDNKLLYSDFVQIVLDYQLNGHVQFLRRFKHCFDLQWHLSEDEKKIPGIISDEDFAAVVESLDNTQTKADVVAMLDRVDPHQTGKITFSQAASVLMEVLIRTAQVPIEDVSDDETSSDNPYTFRDRTL